jgi:hypothetical protein
MIHGKATTAACSPTDRLALERPTLCSGMAQTRYCSSYKGNHAKTILINFQSYLPGGQGE